MRNRVVYAGILAYFWIGAWLDGYLYTVAFLAAHAVLGVVALIAVGGKTPIRLRGVPLWIGVTTVGYALALVRAPDMEGALLECIRMCGIFVVALLVSSLNEESRRQVVNGWMWIGAAAVAVGVMLGLDRNGRLESTLEYANPLAILLLVALLVALGRYVESRRNVYLALMSVHAAGLLLCTSRSVWVLWLLAMIAFLAAWPALRKARMLVPVLLSQGVGWSLAMWVRGDPLFVWTRVTTIQPDTSEFRILLVYWKDSLPMILDWLPFGGGGGGWSLLQSAYRSESYDVKFVHNHVLQLLLDAGVIGLAGFLGLLVYFYRSSARSLRSPERRPRTITALIVGTVMTLHALFDLDFSYSLILAMFVALCGSVAPEQRAIFGLRPVAGARMLRVGLTAALLLGVMAHVWLFVGYAQLMKGEVESKQNRPEQALQAYAAASRWLPWSHQAFYQSAVSHWRIWHTTASDEELVKAKRELEEAMRRAPGDERYETLCREWAVARP